MRSFLTLLKREWLEGRSAYIIAPGIVLTLIVLIGLTASVANYQVNAHNVDPSALTGDDGISFDGPRALVAMALDVAGSTDDEIRLRMASVRVALAAPFYWTLMIVSFFALIAAIYDERKDHSVLFWKSMPVSDLETVLSKYVGIAWIAPLATIGGILLAQFLAITFLSINVEDGFGATIWSQSGLLLSPIQLLLGYLIHSLWVMPVFAWVLFVSAWANKAPILWALGAPVVAIIVEKILFGTNLLGEAIQNHMTLTALPTWSDRELTVADQLLTVVSTDLLLGLFIGLAMLAATVYCRRTYNEI